jgi:hypothetical protein
MKNISPQMVLEAIDEWGVASLRADERNGD